MSAATRPHSHCTIGEYVRLEEHANVKHEFLDGTVWAIGVRSRFLGRFARMGLLPNTEVAFDVVDGEARLRKVAPSSKRSRGDGVIAHLRGVRRSNKLSTDEIMALMRGKA